MVNGILPENERDLDVVSVYPSVKLLSYTPDPLKVVNAAARRCYSSLGNDDLRESIDNLSEDELATFISGVIKTGHKSTIEHVSFTFMIEGVSRPFLGQITRHRLASSSVMSERYVDFDRGFGYIIPPAVEALGDEAMAEYAAQMCTAHQWYLGWREKGIRKEDARFVLPQGTETKMVWTVNARELMHIASLRCCNRAQWEFRYVAEEMVNLVQLVCPGLFEKIGPSCVQFGFCPEGKRGCGDAEGMKKKYAALFELNRLIAKESKEEKE